MENPDLSHPIYDIHKTYLENAEEGPFFAGPLPHFERKSGDHTVLGFKVNSLLGVPAGPLLNARWVAFAAAMGFDIVTYKTIRSCEHAAHPLPNMVYVDGSRFLSPREEGEVIVTAPAARSMEELSLTNSFGIPSRSPEYLLQDIDRARKALKKGQLLIVSVVGTVREGEDFLADFATAASIAVQAGAEVIEADLSCPNLSTAGGSLYTDPEAVLRICQLMRGVVGSRPLVLKMGMIQERAMMRQIATAAAQGGANAISGINTLSMRVVDAKGESVLGPKRTRAGVCGKPIRKAALEFTRLARSVIDEEKLDLELFATGGVTQYSHFDDLMNAGADVAMSALGMMWDPYLALRYHEAKGNLHVRA